MVTYPPGEEQHECALCEEPFESYDLDFAAGYANLVCEQCDERAVTEDGEEPTVGPHDGQGDNPAYIDGTKCWRRIRFGGHITRMDEYDCDTLEEFQQKHREEHV